MNKQAEPLPTLHTSQKASESEGAQHTARSKETTSGPARKTAAWALRLAAGIALFGRGKKRDQPAAARHRAGKATTSVARQDAMATAPTSKPPTVETAGEAPASVETVQGTVALAKEFWQRYNADECPTRAAALAFFGVLSLVPVLLFALAALGFLIRDPQQAAAYVQKFIRQVLPGGQASGVADQVIQQTHVVDSARTLIYGRWWAAIIGVASLLFSAISLLVSASDPMNRAWDVKETRGFLQLRVTALGVFAGAGLLFLLSLLPSAGPDFVRSLHIPWLGLPQRVPVWVDFLFVLAAIFIDLSMFVLIYRFLPNAPVTWRSALFGGVVAGVLWEIFKRALPIYLAHFGNYDKLYGTLGGLVLLVTWIYYSCMVLLGGAILCKMYHEHKEEGGITRRSVWQKEAARP